MNIYVKAIAILALPVFLAVGCEQKFRYPCQDPKNWNTPACSKPLCDVNRDCPEHIFENPSES